MAAPDNRRRRLAALSDRLHERQLDALLVSSLPNVRYLTGFSGTSALLLVTPRAAGVITDFRYETQAADEIGDVAEIRIESSSLWSGLWSWMPTLNHVEVVGFESASLVHRDFQRLLSEGARWSWRPESGLVEELRESKDEAEVASILEAGRMATAALERVSGVVARGMTEQKVAGQLELALREEGSEEAPFPPIVASGPRSALPHARASNRAIEPGDLLLIDFGARYRGYCSDITRTFVMGRPTEEQRETHAIVREAQDNALRGVRPGMSGVAADNLARSYIEERGHGNGFGHSLGHGLGLEVHEAPRLSRTAEGLLQEGSVVTIEPGIYREGWGGVRIEDDVHLSGAGARLLTNFSRELLEVG